MPSSRRLVALAAAAGLTAGCAPPIDTTRTPVDTGSFGETVLTLVCKRMAYLADLHDGDDEVDLRGDAFRDICRLGLAPPASADPAVKALLAKRADLVDAVDTMFPDSFLGDLQAFLTSHDFLATYDDDTTTAAIDALIGTLRLFAEDDDALASLERFNVRLGYRPIDPALGAIRAAVRYPQLHELLLELTRAVTPGGSARGEWDRLIAAIGVTLRNAEASPSDEARDDPDRVARIAADLLLRERALLGTSKTIPLTRRDGRGLAEPVALGGMFVDADGDGRADTDEVGRFVDAAGQPLLVPAPFQLPEGSDEVPWPHRDLQGRPLDGEGGALLYRYVDVDKTLLAALARDAVQLFDPATGTALDLLRGGSALMGPRTMTSRAYANGETLEFRGYDVADSPLLDTAYGYLQVLRDPAIRDVLDLARALLVDHEPVVARLAEAIVGASRLGDAHPEAVIPAAAPLWDDLMPVIRQVLARPQLVTALLRALERPEVKQLGERFRTYMTYKDRFDIHPQTQAVVGAFATPVDRSVADSAFDRSLFQRLLHVIHDSQGARMCNKQGAVVKQYGITLATYDQCALVQIDDLAVFYVQSIAYAKDAQGRYLCENAVGDQTIATTNPQTCLDRGERIRPKADFRFNWGSFVASALRLMGGDGYLESESTIAGFRTHPTPQALNRVLFLSPAPQILADTMDPARDRDGDYYNNQHVGTLPVWELEGFYDQIRPVIQAFADHDAEHLFVEFLAVLHRHWPTAASVTHQTVDPQAPGYVWGSGGNAYEPLLAAILEQRALLDTLVDAAPTLNAITVNGKPYATIVRGAASFLVTPLPGLADRSGATTSTTSDGRPVAVLSPWQVMADAAARKAARLDATGPEGAAWTESIAEVVDVLVRGHDVPTVGWRFRNPRFRGVAVALVDLLRERIARHDALGDRAAWLAEELPGDLERALAGPVFAGAADFVLSLQAAPATRQQLDALVRYLVDEIRFDDAFRTSVTAAADLLQLAVAEDLAPLARVAGEALRPERAWLAAQLAFVRRARESDAGRALARLLVTMFDETRRGRTAIGDLVDGISEVHRARPYDDLGQRFTAADLHALLSGLADFLDEERRGLRKFIAIIKDRSL